MNSDSLSQIDVTARPEVSTDVLLALKRKMPADSVSFVECPAPNLKDLRVGIPPGMFGLPELNTLLETLALTLPHRADFGSCLDRLVVSECLITAAYWDAHMPPEIANMAEWERCPCDSHSWLFSSDDSAVDSDTDTDTDSNSE